VRRTIDNKYENLKNMKKSLIFLDVDNTLIDRQYKSHSSTINFVIDQLQREGHIFVINSNRSFADLLELANKFSFTGYLIGENGAFCYNQKTENREVFVEQKTIEVILEIKKLLLDFIKSYKDGELVICDSVDYLKHLDVHEIANSKDILFILNQFREYSISLHIKKREGDDFVKDLSFVKDFYNQFKSFLNEKLSIDNCCFEYTESFGNILVYPKFPDKNFANAKLFDQYAGLNKIFIADDVKDKIGSLEKADFFFTLANGDEQAKYMADYVAKESLTLGVEEILLNLELLTK